MRTETRTFQCLMMSFITEYEEKKIRIPPGVALAISTGIWFQEIKNNRIAINISGELQIYDKV